MSMSEIKKWKTAELLGQGLSEQGRTVLGRIIVEHYKGNLTSEELMKILEEATGFRNNEHEIRD